MRVRSGTATGERCPIRRGPSSAPGESERRSWERPAERPGPASGAFARSRAHSRAARFLRFLRARPPAFLRTIGALRLARTRDGRLHVAGLSPRGARHWEVLASPRRSQRPPDDVVLWVVLDLDAARRRLKS